MKLNLTPLLAFLISGTFMAPLAIAQTTPPPSIGVPAPSKGKAFNPDIGANFLGIVRRDTGLSDDRTAVPRNGLSLQEAELQFTADVDPYLRAVVLMSIAQESGGTGFGIDPEEVFAESIALPLVTLRAGQFKMALGKHNQLHTHAFPFIDAPLIHQQLLGDEGLNETGVSAAVLLPLSWYSEVLVQGFSPSNDILYNSAQSGEVGGLARLKNLWDLTDDLTMEFGLSGTAGKNQYDRTSSAFGTDLTLKWRPAIGGKYHALIWSTEYLRGNVMGRGETVIDPNTGTDVFAPTDRLGGAATWLQYQFDARWWVQARYEFVGLPRSTALKPQNKQSLLLGFFGSEFSGLRLQYDHLVTTAAPRTDHAVALQYNISIGAHPAHAY